MVRTAYFYLAVCCGALALANLVWASPPDKVRKVTPTQPPKGVGATPMPKMTPMPLDLKLPAKKSIEVAPIVDKKIDPVVKILPKFEPKIEKKAEPKLTKPLVLTKPIDLGKVSTTPALKLPKDTKFDVADLKKIKPPVDLSKVSGEKLVKMKPPADFKVKTTDLAKIHIPADAVKVANLNAKFNFNGQKFILNKNAYTGTNYHLLHGVKCAWGYAYHGHHHCHWHHSIWDPCCGCYYYYDPCCSCYYYWCETEVCYYPCWWFVSYCDTYYPWWVCGGFEHWGYHHHHHHPHFAIRIGW
jgi:hypothetical protein